MGKGEGMRVAAVDIGTNTVRCLVAEAGEGEGVPRLRPLLVLREITRLGEGLRAAGRITPAAEERTEAALARFGEEIRRWGVARGRAVATAAARDGGSPAFLSRLGSALGFPVEVIDGGEEARLTAWGMRACVGVRDGIALDIGGGSTELVRLEGERILWWRSLPEGVVHLTEAFLRGDPPPAGELEALRGRIRELLSPLPADGGGTLVATAGTPTTLAALDLRLDAYEPALVNGYELTSTRLGALTARLAALPASGRLLLPGMEPGREDLILAGALFLGEVMERWRFPAAVVSDGGLLEGIALDVASRPAQPRRP